MAASVGIGFQCVQCAAEGGFRALTGSPARDVRHGPGLMTATGGAKRVATGRGTDCLNTKDAKGRNEKDAEALCDLCVKILCALCVGKGHCAWGRLRPGAYTETPSDARAAEDVGPYHGTTW